MDAPEGGGSSSNLPSPPARPPGMAPPTLPAAAAARHDGAESSKVEPPGKKQRQSQFEILKRPGFGTKGMKTDLICNHFRVAFQPSQPVFHYNVIIDPPMKSVVNRKVMKALHSTYGQEFLKGKHFVYDGEKSLFVVGSLSLKQSEFPVTIEDEPGRGRRAGPSAEDAGTDAARPARPGNEFKVRIVEVAQVDMRIINAMLRGERAALRPGEKGSRPEDALRVLDIMLREYAAKKSYLLLKDSYFDESLGPVFNMGEGVDMWRGFHVSFRPTSGGLSLNFDVSTSLVFRPVKVHDFLQEYCKKPPGSFRQEDWMKARRVLKGLLVMTYADRKHKIIGFSPETCNNQMFPKRVKQEGVTVDTVEVSVAQYFETERKYKLKYPNLPALDVGRGSKPVYLPMELCTIIKGQRYKRALTTSQRQAQIDQTRQPPPERRRLIQEMMGKADYNKDDLIKEFNVSFDSTMKAVTGRVLDPPKLMFGKNFEETPRNGRWNFGAKTMRAPVEIPNWAVVNFRGRFNLDGQKIGSEMKNVCSQKGMKLGEFVLIDEDMRMKNRAPLDRVNEVVKQVKIKLEKYMDVVGLERAFVLAILPEKSPDLYIPFKRICEVELGIVTQCIVPPKGQVNPKYLTSVSLKINLKRGGYNSVLSSEELQALPKVSQMPTIIFGLDVSHGSPGDANSPSVAAAVATIDWPRVSRYTTSIRAQSAKTEMIEDLYVNPKQSPKAGVGMVRELLLRFHNFERRRVKPLQIVIFRDGVSESQFDQVLDKELAAFKRTCRSMDAEYDPKITMIVVQKRHHTRFFPAKSSGNVVPGTIVDRDPCHPRNYDFYLCSHAGIIGTSRPTHYHILHDEIGFSPDELQQLTNSLCYSYTRCTSAVSVVAPAYYAHLAAQHCRHFVQDNYDSGSEASSQAAKQAALASLPVLREEVMKQMFYA